MQRILAIADPGSGSQPALARAVELARRAGTHLHCVAFIYTHGLEARDAGTRKGEPDLLSAIQIETARAALLDRRERELNAALAAIDCRGVKVTSAAIWAKDVAGWIATECATRDTGMVIKTGHRSEQWNYTPTDWRLLRDCPAPVMIVAARSWKKRPRLLAALDLGSRKRAKQQLNLRVLAQGRLLADVLGAELHVVYVLELPQVLVDLDLIDPRRHAAQQRRALEATVAALAEAHAIPLDHFHLLPGQPHRVIPRLANKLKSDTVLLGSIGRSGTRARLLGNTAEAVLSHLHTDIVAIKPE